jgi:hypothetical protein
MLYVRRISMNKELEALKEALGAAGENDFLFQVK